MLAALVVLLTGCGIIEYAEPGDGHPTQEAPSAEGDAETAEETEDTFVEVMSPRRSEDDFHAGVAVLAYGNDEPEGFEAKSAALLDRLAGLHVNAVSLTYPLFQDGWEAAEVRADPRQTPSEENIATFIREAKRRGFTVLLRPVLDEQSLTSTGHWRGSIAPADLDAWFESYGGLLVRAARVADAEGADILAVGTELTSLHDERRRWRSLISGIRRSFDGQVTYATNWDATAPAHHPAFVEALDFLSVDAFFPLEAAPDAGVSELVEAWRPWIREVRRLGPPLGEIVFTEVGVRAQEGAHRRPYVWEHDAPPSAGAQRRYYAAACAALGDRIGGLYWWMVDIHHPTEAPSVEDFSPLGKPAERELARCFEDGS